MNVAYLVPAPGIPVQGPSGASAHVRGLATALGCSHDLRVYAARREDHRGRFGEPVPAWTGGVPGWPSWLDRWRDGVEVRAARRLGRRVIEDAHRGWVPGLVLERHGLFSDAGWRAHDRLGVPWVLEVNAPLLLERRRFEVVRRPEWAGCWEQRVLQAAPCLAAVSTWLVDWLEGEVGCRNVHHVPNGTAGHVGDRDRGRALLGATPDEPLVGFVGSMKRWHGVERVVPAATAAGARPVLIGTRSAVEGALCPGFLAGQDLADAIAALDVGLAPYPADAPPWFCPLKVLDYRAQGTPVVGSDIGDVALLVEDGGSVVPPDDDDALVDAIRHWLGRRTPAHARTWEDVAHQVVGLA